MIFLLFSIGEDRYALEAGRVAEVLPRLGLKKIPQAPPGIAGLADYHGSTVPVVDLNAMALGIPARESMSTRLLIVRYPAPPDGEERLLGVLGEMATETIRLGAQDFHEPGVSGEPDAPYLGPVAHVAGRIVQRVEIEKLLSPETRERLWPTAGTTS